jgi:hexosaminidase
MKTPEQVMYMALPRLCALSEVLWSGPGKSSYNEFTKRLIPHFKLLDSLQYNYSKALFNIESQTTVKNGKMFVSLQSDFPDYDIRYTSDGSAPMVSSSLYNESIQINNDVVIKARLFKNGKASGNTFSQEYKYHLAIGKKIKLLYPPDERYNTGGASTLINGIVGSLPWSGNEWLGWRGESMEVTLDLGLVEEIHRVKISFLEAKESWIHLPKKVVVLVGRDEKKYREIELSNLEGGFTFSGDLNLYERYLKIKAIPQIIIPNGNPGAGQKPWLFCSEIIIE